MKNNSLNIKNELKKIHDQAYKISVKLETDGKLPSKVRDSDAGFDLYATEDITLYPGQVLKHPLNIRLQLPINTWAEITTKSSLGSKGQLVFSGVIDQEYRGVVHVIMTNVNLIQGIDPEGFPLMRVDPIVVKKGEKIAQMIMHPFSSEFFIEEVKSLDLNTSRGEGGFGSTGR